MRVTIALRIRHTARTCRAPLENGLLAGPATPRPVRIIPVVSGGRPLGRNAPRSLFGLPSPLPSGRPRHRRDRGSPGSAGCL